MKDIPEPYEIKMPDIPKFNPPEFYEIESALMGAGKDPRYVALEIYKAKLDSYADNINARMELYRMQLDVYRMQLENAIQYLAARGQIKRPENDADP